MSTRSVMIGLAAALTALAPAAAAVACPHPGHHHPVVTTTPEPTTPVTPEPTTVVPGDVRVTVVTVNGTGCPIGTADASVTPDGQSVTATYSQFVAEVGEGIPASSSRANCQLNLAVYIPDGFTVAVDQLSTGGFASIADGASATVRTSVYFQGSTATGAITNTIAGPYQDSWQFTDDVDAASLVWRPCGGDQRNLNINTSLVVNRGSSESATSYVTIDSPDPLFGLDVARC